MAGYFLFNSIDSRDYGFLDKIPIKPKAAQNVNKITIPGRDTEIFSTTPEFANITLNAVLGLKNATELSNIYQWLHGSGNLIFSNDLTRCYRATCFTDVIPEYLSQRFSKLPLRFDCKPFLYAVDNDPIELTNPALLEVDGNIYAQPIYTIYGTGDIALIVNNAENPLYIEDVDESITIDCEKMIAYKGAQVLTNKTTGEFPTLNVGENTIGWSGTVTQIDVVKNERWY